MTPPPPHLQKHWENIIDFFLFLVECCFHGAKFLAAQLEAPAVWQGDSWGIPACVAVLCPPPFHAIRCWHVLKKRTGSAQPRRMKRRLHFNLKREPTGSLSDYIQAVPSPSESRDLDRFGRKVRERLSKDGIKRQEGKRRVIMRDGSDARQTTLITQGWIYSRFTGVKLIASLCSSLGLSELVSFQSSPSHDLQCPPPVPPPQ